MKLKKLEKGIVIDLDTGLKLGTGCTIMSHHKEMFLGKEIDVAICLNGYENFEPHPTVQWDDSIGNYRHVGPEEFFKKFYKANPQQLVLVDRLGGEIWLKEVKAKDLMKTLFCGNI